MSNLQKKYRRIPVVLGSITILTGFGIAFLIMAKSRSALGLPMGSASLEGIRLKFIAWLTICLFSIPLAFYLSRVFVHAAFGLLMVTAGRFTPSEARHFALDGSYPGAWFKSEEERSTEAMLAVGSAEWSVDKDGSLISGLITDNEKAVAAFGESDNCVVVDWRGGAEEIFEALTPFLPQGYLRTEKLGSTRWKVHAGDRPPRTIEYLRNTRQEDFFVILNDVLAPDFELWRYTPMDGDGYSLFLAPTAWWRSFAEEHPRALSKYFLSANRLAAYWRKGYLSRLFSSP